MGVMVNSQVSGLYVEDRYFQRIVTLDGTAGLGAVGAITLLNIAGTVQLDALIVRCLSDLTVNGGTGTASLELGFTGNTAYLSAIAAATVIDTGEFWTTATPTAVNVSVPGAWRELYTGANLIATVSSTGTQVVNGGVILCSTWWRPMSLGANVF